MATPIARCVMVTRAQPGGIDIDREVPRRIHRDRARNLSVGGSVTDPGLVQIGDELTTT
ncbi:MULTISPECIES: hypothetical protein [Pseudonocardia]|uniref:MOSC domain-containing protein n=1 Tax=Pseudonocardia autotrophica TaxID=2074 RepID=A0A1Y2MIF7_PSEAH|nr:MULTISPECIES: hypothetical protein [Pseudonocardia]OSY34487.1 hypothetical protein BG845_06799 [Pseudonocardia autotrophica]TDN77173.1 hypothetical protein C8E95_6402 [Pseudonocardia autotrophica]